MQSIRIIDITEKGGETMITKTIQIRRQWNSYKIATTLLEYLEKFHWDNVSGGVCRQAPQYFLHAQVLCTAIDGDFDHSCEHGPPPHKIKVCIVKKDNKESWQELLKLVGTPKPQMKKKIKLSSI